MNMIVLAALTSKKKIVTYFGLQEDRVAPDPQQALDHHDPHLVLGVLYKYLLTPQGPL